jgi:hypothetical protein
MRRRAIVTGWPDDSSVLLDSDRGCVHMSTEFDNADYKLPHLRDSLLRSPLPGREPSYDCSNGPDH